MKNFIVGIIIGLLLGGGVAWAAGQFTWVDTRGNTMGTTSNPIYVTSI